MKEKIWSGKKQIAEKKKSFQSWIPLIFFCILLFILINFTDFPDYWN